MFRECEIHSSAFSTDQPTKVHFLTQCNPTCGMYNDTIECHPKNCTQFRQHGISLKIRTIFYFSESVNNTRYDFLFTLFYCDFRGICLSLCICLMRICPTRGNSMIASEPNRLMVWGNYVISFCHCRFNLRMQSKSLYPFLLGLLVVVPRNT